jgi:hypothetical protein
VRRRILLVLALVLTGGCEAGASPPVNAPVFASVAVRSLGLPGRESAAEGAPSCPPETWFSGFACDHAVATCGGWDGQSCVAPSTAAVDSGQAQEQEKEFFRTDAELRETCPEDDAKRQVFAGSAVEILLLFDAASSRAMDIDRVDRARLPLQPPRWRIWAAGRIGSVFECIWNSVRQAVPTSFVTPQQWLLLTHRNFAREVKQFVLLGVLQNADWSVYSPSQLQGPFVGAPKELRAYWEWAHESAIAEAAREVVRAYITSDLLARRYAIGGVPVTRARQRLSIVAQMLGERTIRDLLSHIPDPQADPDRRRQARYIAALFGPPP